jgi:hypothetical protein
MFLLPHRISRRPVLCTPSKLVRTGTQAARKAKRSPYRYQADQEREISYQKAETRAVASVPLQTSDCIRHTPYWSCFRHLLQDPLKLRQRFFELHFQYRAPRVQNPIIFGFDRSEFCFAQPKRFPQQSFCPISIMCLANRLFRCCYPDPLNSTFVRQNKDCHKAAFNAATLFVNTQKLGALGEPSLFR